MAGGFVDPFSGGSGSKSSGGGSGSSGSSGGFVDPFAGGSSAAKKSGGGGGFLGGLESAGHWVASKASLAGHDIEAFPGFALKAAELPVKQTYYLATGQVGKAQQNTKDAENFSSQYWHGVGHAARHPLADPFATASLLAPALHLPFRGAEVLRGTDITAPRLLKTGDGEFNLSPPSKNAAGRAAQAGYTKASQVALDKQAAGTAGKITGKIASHANRRIGSQINEEVRPIQRMKASVADTLEQAGRKAGAGKVRSALRASTKVPRRAQEDALRLWVENSTPEEARAFHLGQAEKGIEPKANKTWAARYGTVIKHGLLSKDETGNVVANADRHPAFGRVVDAAKQAGAKSDAIIQKYGLMTPEGMAAREALPAQLRRAGIPEAERAQGTYSGEPRGFVTYKDWEARASKTGAARTASPIIGEAKNPIGGGEFTGQSLEHGRIPENVSRLIGRHLRDLQRFENTNELRRRWLDTGSSTRRSENDVLIREPGTPKKDISAEIKASVGSGKQTLDEQLGEKEGLKAAFDTHLKGFFGKNDQAIPHESKFGFGDAAPKGYRWVDRGVIGDFEKRFQGSAGKPARAFNNINSAITAQTVYYKIGHVGTRLLTDTATNLIEGSLKHSPASFKLWKALNPQDRIRALDASGQHGFNAMPHEGEGRIGRAATKGANWWARHVDAPFRFNSIAYQAAKAGYKTPAQFRDFLNKLENPEGLPAEERARVANVAKLANRENISYDRLNDYERRFLSRGLWFYPWVKGSTAFTARTFAEHPFKGAAIGIDGQQGRENQAAKLGPVPSYEGGLIPLGGGPKPLVTDFSTFSPMATAGSLLQLPRYGAAADNLNPVASLLLHLGTRTNQYGAHSNSPLLDAAQSALSPTPEFQIAHALVGKKPSKMFPTDNPVLAAIERMLVGPAMPRHYDVSVGNQSAAREKAGR